MFFFFFTHKKPQDLCIDTPSNTKKSFNPYKTAEHSTGYPRMIKFSPKFFHIDTVHLDQGTVTPLASKITVYGCSTCTS